MRLWGECDCHQHADGANTATALTSPGQTPVGVGCFMFPYGPTGADSLANLCLAISFSSPYYATLAASGGVLQITFTAKVTGPFSNYDTVTPDGRYGVGGGATFGGGYSLESVGPSPYSVTLTGIFGFFSEPTVQFDFTLGPTGSARTVGYALGTVGVSRYTIVANPYSFAMFSGTDAIHSIAAFAPCVPTAEGFTARTACSLSDLVTSRPSLCGAAVLRGSQTLTRSTRLRSQWPTTAVALRAVSQSHSRLPCLDPQRAAGLDRGIRHVGGILHRRAVSSR